MTTRAEQRAGFDQPTRLRLAEGDIDDLYRLHAESLAESKKHTVLLIGMLVSLTTACILMVINVLVMGG